MKIKPANKAAIDNIIEKAGGDIAVSYHLTTKHSRSISQFALRQWRSRGIPEDYWLDLSAMSGLSVDVIFQACGG
jgi:hypothetical protein